MERQEVDPDDRVVTPKPLPPDKPVEKPAPADKPSPIDIKPPVVGILRTDMSGGDKAEHLEIRRSTKDEKFTGCKNDAVHLKGNPTCSFFVKEKHLTENNRNVDDSTTLQYTSEKSKAKL